MHDDAKLEAALAVLKDVRTPQVGSFGRHVKTGGVYMVCGGAVWEATVEAALAYRAADGVVWIRPVAEFTDGRFVPTRDPDNANAEGG